MCVCLSTVRGLGWSHDLWLRLCNGNVFSWASEPQMVPVKWQTIFPLKRGHNGSTQYIKLLSSPLMFQRLKLDVSSHPISLNENDHYLMNSQRSPNWNHKSFLLAGHLLCLTGNYQPSGASYELNMFVANGALKTFLKAKCLKNGANVFRPDFHVVFVRLPLVVNIVKYDPILSGISEVPFINIKSFIQLSKIWWQIYIIQENHLIYSSKNHLEMENRSLLACSFEPCWG